MGCFGGDWPKWLAGGFHRLNRSGLGQTNARLVTIGELNASGLKRPLQRLNRALMSDWTTVRVGKLRDRLGIAPFDPSS
jgi:hypothetical protein